MTWKIFVDEDLCARAHDEILTDRPANRAAAVLAAVASNIIGQNYTRLAPFDRDGGGGRAVDLDGAVGRGVEPRGGIGTTNAKVSFFVELNPYSVSPIPPAPKRLNSSSSSSSSSRFFTLGESAAQQQRPARIAAEAKARSAASIAVAQAVQDQPRAQVLRV